MTVSLASATVKGKKKQNDPQLLPKGEKRPGGGVEGKGRVGGGGDIKVTLS